MKKALALLCIIVVLFGNVPPVTAESEDSYDTSSMVFQFPASLKVVEDEAFAGTLVRFAVFSNNLLFIGSDVFMDADNLTDIYIPPTTKYISDFALPLNRNILVHGQDDSYAYEWALNHSYTFTTDTIRISVAQNKYLSRTLYLSIVFSSFIPDPKEVIRKIRKAKEWIRSMRPQDRIELHPINNRFP